MGLMGLSLWGLWESGVERGMAEREELTAIFIVCCRTGFG